jgi:ADP-ribose pyrophosphatase YjhB (NUDIX family)
MGVTPVLWPSDSLGLVSARPILACPTIGLFALAPSNGLWKAPSAPWNTPAGCLAVWQLASRLSQSDAVTLPVKHSIAVVVRDGNQILAIRRPDDDDELPGIWGLPAGTFRASETLDDLIRRIGRDKLGVSLRPVRKLAEGAQDRERYRLAMELWEAAMTGTPDISGRIQWKWTALEELKQGSEQGSLCCRLALSQAG